MTPHPDWSPSSNVADTNKVFVIIESNIRPEFMADAAQATEYEMNELEVAVAADEDDLMAEINELEEAGAADVDDLMADMPHSMTWLATIHGLD